MSLSRSSVIYLLPLWLAACSSSGGEQDLGLDSVVDAARDSVEMDTTPPLPDGPPPPGTFSEVASFGSNPGALRMFTYVPGAMPAGPAPLVVVLHGCSLTAAEFAAASGWNDLADRKRFYVIYPQQSAANNQYACFNWFEPGDTGRDKGEALSIVQMMDQMAKDHAVDPTRVFATGLSAGAAMVVALGAAYPDRFAGLAPMAGIPYGCATSAVSGVSCMKGVDKAATEWGALARKAYPSYGGAYPVVSLFHGTADSMVAFACENELAEQWTDLHGADATPDVEDSVGAHAHKVYKDKQGAAVVETFALQGMDHGVAVDPGSGEGQGGKTTWFSFDVDLWAPYHAAKLWGL